jgi:hypothetical protein
MPSLVRFLFVAATLSAITFGGLYVLAVYFEPESKEVSRPIHNVKVRKE